MFKPWQSLHLLTALLKLLKPCPPIHRPIHPPPPIQLLCSTHWLHSAVARDQEHHLAALSSPTSSCYGLLFINDVSIPDDTKMAPGQQFTKTWLVQNTGGCAWQPGFKWTLISGNPMGGSTVTLSQSVAPGAQYQISVPMIAPNASGESVGNWRMSDANGNFFGQPVWVKVMVGGNGATNTPNVTSTATP